MRTFDEPQVGVGGGMQQKVGVVKRGNFTGDCLTQGGFLPPSDAVEALGVSQQVDEEERLLLAAAAPTTTEEMHPKALMTTNSIPVILGVRRVHIHNEEVSPPPPHPPQPARALSLCGTPQPSHVTPARAQDAIDRALDSLDKNDEGSRQASGPWYGGWWIVIFGKNFGETKRGVAALIGGRPCLQTIWIGSQMILCMVPRGPGGEADLKVVANGRVMSLMGAVAFELPRVTAIQPSNSPTFGGIFVTLSGERSQKKNPETKPQIPKQPAPNPQQNLSLISPPPLPPPGEHFGFLDTSPNMGLASSGDCAPHTTHACVACHSWVSRHQAAKSRTGSATRQCCARSSPASAAISRWAPHPPTPNNKTVNPY